MHSFRNYASLFICIHALQFIDAPETIFVYLCNSWHTLIAVFLCSLVIVVRVDVGFSLSRGVFTGYFEGGLDRLFKDNRW